MIILTDIFLRYCWYQWENSSLLLRPECPPVCGHEFEAYLCSGDATGRCLRGTSWETCCKQTYCLTAATFSYSRLILIMTLQYFSTGDFLFLIQNWLEPSFILPFFFFFRWTFCKWKVTLWKHFIEALNVSLFQCRGFFKNCKKRKEKKRKTLNK